MSTFRLSTDLVVQALLEQTMGEEERERRCESCSSEKAMVGGKIVTQPRLLILNLKRYSAEGSVHDIAQQSVKSMYGVRCTLYAVRCTLYAVRCTLGD